MAKLDASAIAALKAANPLDEIIERGGVRLGRANGKGIRAFPCLCDPQRGKTPCWVNTHSNTWGCLKGGCGGDVFSYLEQFEGLDFSRAVEHLGGRDVVADAAALERAEKKRRERAAMREKADAAEREAERRRSYEVFKRGLPFTDSLAEIYLAGRGIDCRALGLDYALRFLPDEPYWHEVNGKPEIIYRGPALMAGIQRPDSKFSGVHLTWFDPARLGEKMRILAPDGEPCPPKKVKGLAAGGAIRLTQPLEENVTLLVGEGIETTLSAMTAMLMEGAVACYAAWAAVSLDNLAGRGRGESTPHPDKPSRRVPSPEPDLDHPGMMPPDWAETVIILGDGDSDRLVTLAKLQRAQKRFQAAGFATSICMADDGKDFNDMLRGR